MPDCARLFSREAGSDGVDERKESQGLGTRGLSESSSRNMMDESIDIGGNVCGISGIFELSLLCDEDGGGCGERGFREGDSVHSSESLPRSLTWYAYVSAFSTGWPTSTCTFSASDHHLPRPRAHHATRIGFIGRCKVQCNHS